MVGMVGFEPTHNGVKVRCLTTWRHPKTERFFSNQRYYIKNYMKSKKYFTFLAFILSSLYFLFQINIEIMMKFLQLLTKRPKDTTILRGLIVFWLLISLGNYYNLIYQGDALETQFFWQNVNEDIILIIKYIFVAIGLIPLYLWLTKQCLLKKKYMRYLQGWFWILLIYMSSKIVELWKLDIEELLFLLSFPAIIAWITGKCITSTCMKYKEKIQKIRI